MCASGEWMDGMGIWKEIGWEREKGQIKEGLVDLVRSLNLFKM